jgi:hypothetical protein
MDLTSDPAQATPTPGAKIASWARRRRPPVRSIELADEEDPSEAGNVAVHRQQNRESSNLSLMIRVWKAIHISLDYDVHGPDSWFAPLYAVVLMAAVLVALVVPTFILPEWASGPMRVAVSAAFGGAVLLTGILTLCCLRRKS